MNLVLIALSCSLSTSLRMSYNNENPTYWFSPFFPEEGLQEFNVRAIALGVNDIFDSQWEGRANGTIGVLLGDDSSGKFREDYGFRAMELGMVGLVAWTSWEPDHFAEFYDPSVLHNINIPYVSVRLEDRELMRGMIESGNATITLLSSDSPNGWPEALNSVWYKVIWRGMLSAYALILSVIAFVALLKWFWYWQRAKTFSRIAVLCLVVEFICCVERAIFHMIGGLVGCRTVAWPGLRLMYTVTLPLNFLTTALTAAYLHEVLTTKSPLGTMVQKTQKPLCCLSIYYLLTDWPFSLISSFSLFFGSGVLATISSGMLTVGTGITAILLLYITIRLGRYYQKKTPKKTDRSSVGRTSEGNKDDAKSESKAPPDRLKELVSRVQISTFWLLWTTLGFIFTLLPQFHEPVGYAVINIWIFIGLNTTSLMHILAYGKTPRMARRGTSVSMSMRSSIDNNGSQPSRKPKMPNLAVVAPVDSQGGSSRTDVEAPDSSDRSDAESRHHAISVSDQMTTDLMQPRKLTEGYDELEG